MSTTDKKCIKCNEIKYLMHFYKDKSKKDSLSTYCKKCSREKSAMWAKSNPEKHNKSGKAWKKANPEKVKTYNLQYNKKNLEKNRAKRIKWEKANPERNKALHKKWKNENRGKVNASWYKRKAAKLNATPRWLTESHLKEIEQHYIDAAECQWLSEEPLHVDHIVPLQGKDVCGLHVPWNLQILPASKNYQKSNKLVGS